MKTATLEAYSLDTHDDHRDLLNEDFEWAVCKKYERGVALHGKEWVGPRPLLCLHEEILDAYVYADLEYAAGEVDRSVLLEIMASLVNIRRGVQVLLGGVPESRLDGWARRDSTQARFSL